MTSVGAILNADIKLPSSNDLARWFAWLAEGMAKATPSGVKRFLWAPAGRFIDLETGDEPAILEADAFGAYRLGRLAQGAEHLPTVIRVPNDEVFFTEVNLPKDVASDAAAAVELRFEEISPLKRAYCDFAIGKHNNEESGRINVPVAIVRQSTIDDLKEQYGPHAKIVAGAANGDSLEFVFGPGIHCLRAVCLNALPTIALVAGLAVLYAGVLMHLNRQQDVASAEITELVLVRKDLRQTVHAASSIIEASETGPSKVSLDHELYALSQAVDSLGEDTVWKSATIAKETIRLTGKSIADGGAPRSVSNTLPRDAIR